jgi:hypothetical protein
MYQENDIAPFIDEMKDLKLRFKNAIINSNIYTSYTDKLDLVSTHDIGKLKTSVINIEDLIPKTLKKYPVLKRNETYYEFNYEKYESISFSEFSQRLCDYLIDEEEFDYDDEKHDEAKEFISQELYEYYLKTDIIEFRYDW